METKPLRFLFGHASDTRFKTGRYREFFQYGVELIGATGPLAEAEERSLFNGHDRCLWLRKLYVKIGHVGVLKDILIGLGP